MVRGIPGSGPKRGKFHYGKKIDHYTQWELEKRDADHERMVREFFVKRAKEAKQRRKHRKKKRDKNV